MLGAFVQAWAIICGICACPAVTACGQGRFKINVRIALRASSSMVRRIAFRLSLSMGGSVVKTAMNMLLFMVWTGDGLGNVCSC